MLKILNSADAKKMWFCSWIEIHKIQYPQKLVPLKCMYWEPEHTIS